MGRLSIKTEDKTCLQCGAFFNRRAELNGELEPPCSLVKRKFCSQKCVGLFRRGRRMKPVRTFEDKTCIQCRSPFGRKLLSDGQLEAEVNFNRRKFCSRECVHQYRHGRSTGRRKVVENKICIQCASPFNRTVFFNGVVEVPASFYRRQFCSRECYYKYRCKVKLLEDGEFRLNSDGYVVDRRNRRMHRVIMEQYLGRPLRPDEHIHHVDGRRNNNFISNLELLSREEHSRLHIKSMKRNRGKLSKCQ